MAARSGGPLACFSGPYLIADARAGAENGSSDEVADGLEVTMKRVLTMAGLLIAVSMTASPGLAQEDAPAGLASSEQMTQDRGESWTFVKPGLDLKSVTGVVIEPAVVFSGAGSEAQF